MDIELLKLALSKASSIDEARKFLEDFGLGTRQEIKRAELAISYGAAEGPGQPAKPAPELESPTVVTADFTPEQVPPGKRGGGLNALKRWSDAEIAELAMLMSQFSRPGYLPAGDIAARFKRSTQAISAMALNVIHMHTNYPAQWTPALKAVMSLARAHPRWPTGDIPDHRRRKTKVAEAQTNEEPA